MLKNIPNNIPPQLLKILDEMGHGDEICLGDANFPAASIAKEAGAELVIISATGVQPLLDAILQLMPLDDFVDKPVKLMERTPGFTKPIPVWDDYKETISRYDSRGADTIQFLERFAFYEHAKRCYCVVLTGETSQFANVILKKGVIV